MTYLPKAANPQGNITFFGGDRHIPFKLAWGYYLYDPAGSEGGGHAPRAWQELFVAMCGSCDAVLGDGPGKKRFHLSRAYCGLYICLMIWRWLDNSSSGAVSLALASNFYDETDYYCDYGECCAALKDTAR